MSTLPTNPLKALFICCYLLLLTFSFDSYKSLSLCLYYLSVPACCLHLPLEPFIYQSIVILNSLSDDSNTRVMSDSDGCFVSSDFFSCLLAYFVIFLLITRYVMSIETKIDY